MPITLRPAYHEEAADIAAFHVRIWRETYKDIAPPEVIEKLDIAHRLPTWQGYLNTPHPKQHTLVAVRRGELGADILVGIIMFGPASHPAFGQRGEIKHLYVDPACKRQGIGRSLLRAALRQMSGDGFQMAGLAVVRENTAAQAFYWAAGGERVGYFIDAGPLWKSENLIFGWQLSKTHIDACV